MLILLPHMNMNGMYVLLVLATIPYLSRLRMVREIKDNLIYLHLQLMLHMIVKIYVMVMGKQIIVVYAMLILKMTVLLHIMSARIQTY